jgi:hypothetical protein
MSAPIGILAIGRVPIRTPRMSGAQQSRGLMLLRLLHVKIF